MTFFDSNPPIVQELRREEKQRKEEKRKQQAASMPSKKQRKAQLQPQPVQSDYDTDTANYTDNATVSIPAPPVRSNEELNMLVLRRWCPEIEEIIKIAPFAVLYSFSFESEQWEKLETQGSLFVCQLAGDAYPRYRIIILNRKSPENFHLDLTSPDNVTVQDKFVVVQDPAEDGTPQIWGLWMYSDGDAATDTFADMARVIADCAAKAEQFALGDETEEYDEEQNGHDAYECGTDGAAQQETEAYAYEELLQHQPVLPMPQTGGQSINLATLFAKPQMQQNDYAQPPPVQQQSTQSQANMQSHEQQDRFSSNPDTDLFRSSQSPAFPQQQQNASQNALLDLFKSAKRG